MDRVCDILVAHVLRPIMHNLVCLIYLDVEYTYKTHDMCRNTDGLICGRDG